MFLYLKDFSRLPSYSLELGFDFPQSLGVYTALEADSNPFQEGVQYTQTENEHE